MKIFAVYANVELTRKPDWLDEFRGKYDEPYDYHVTFKQPCFVEENKVADIKDKLAKFTSGFNIPSHSISVLFNRLTIAADTPDDICIMINTADNTPLHDLQKNLVAALDVYNDYCKPESSDWEKNFKPHITIARDLNQAGLQQAKKDLEENYFCEGKITELVLAVVDNISPEEAKKPENLTIYKL